MNVGNEKNAAWMHASQTALASATSSTGKLTASANPAWFSLTQARSVLLLQGPLGPFYDRLALWLQSLKITVNRIVFQGGDKLDCQVLNPIPFCEPLSQWAAFFRQQLTSLDIDHIVLFGQSRAYHTVAREVAQQVGVQVLVLEEGYFRPGFATMEIGGVNGYSTTLSRYSWSQGVDDLRQLPGAFKGCIQPDISPHHFQKMAWHASQHYLAIRREAKSFPHYTHHKQDNPYWYARYWVWSWVKKLWYRRADHATQQQLVGYRTPYYFVPLQHDGDAQITHHSCFSQNTDFIIRVMRSFCEFADPDSLLVFRQHPHSRGGAGHAQFINSLAHELGIRSRVLHLVEGDTPLLAQRSAGVVLINSTVGLQALERGAPLIVLGDALYRQPQLSFWDGLDLFWQNAQKPDATVTAHFLNEIKNLTQVPVSLYANRSEPLTWGC